MQQLTEIRWHARAGQGAVTAAKVVAETALSADQYMQAMPEYGPERMGAPIKAFTRISDEPIEIHNNIEIPDVVIVLDETLLDVVDVTEGLKSDGVLIINTCSPAAAVKEALGLPDTARCACVDASGIALDTIKRDIPNTPIVGALIRRDRRHRRRGLQGASRQELRQEVRPGDDRRQLRGRRSRVRGGDRGVSKWDVSDINKWKSDEFPRGAVIPTAGNSDDYVTGGWRSERPYRDDDKCTQCLLCWVFCPDTSVMVEGREGLRLRLRPLQGLRHLRPRVPGGRHRDGARGLRTPGGEVDADAEDSRHHRQHHGRRGDSPVRARRRRLPIPITPQTTIVEEFAKFVAQGRVHTEYVTVESEHSAMSACVGASAAGARVMTATSSQGLALMWEELHIAAGHASADRDGQRQPRAVRADQHPLRPLRHHGRARHRLDHLLRRDRAGGLRQHDHGRSRRRAPRRAAAGHDHARRLHHHALHRPRRDHGRRDASRRSSATTSPRTRCSTSTTPSAHGNFAGLGGPYFEFKKSQRNAIDRSHGRHQGRRRRVVRALRPPVRRHRGLGHGGRRVRRSSPSARPPATRATSPASCAPRA